MNDIICRHGMQFTPGVDFTPGPGRCRVCWLLWHQEHNRLVKHDNKVHVQVSRSHYAADGVKSLNSETGRRSPCRYKGDDILVSHSVKLGLNPQKHWYNCELGKGIVCECQQCATCSDRVPEDRFPVRHLLYHVFPVRGNGIWQWNVNQLKERWNLFTGKKILTIANGKVTDSAESVLQCFGDCKFDSVIEIANDPNLREVKSWHLMWNEVRSLNSDEITFYGHAKGVTRPFNEGSTIQRWIEILYEANLDYYPIVLDLLDRYPIAGAFKKLGKGFQGSISDWHYSGTFYWIRNRDFFTTDWQRIDQRWWGTESWPGIHFRREDAGCIYGEGTLRVLDLYGMTTFNPLYLEFQKWKQNNTKRRSDIGLLTVSLQQITQDS